MKMGFWFSWPMRTIFIKCPLHVRLWGTIKHLPDTVKRLVASSALQNLEVTELSPSAPFTPSAPDLH